MKPTRITEGVLRCIKAKEPVFIWGAPGVGKSQVVRNIADQLKYELIDVRAVLLDPVDLRGLPMVVDGVAKWCPPAFLPTKGKSILFLDELNAAPPLVQAACYQLILDRKLGEYTLPKDCVIVAAGNRESDRAVVSRMSSALANRFVHLNFDVDLEEWTAWALDAGVQTEIIAFLRFRPELLHKFNPQSNERAFPTPRSWEFCSKIMGADASPLDLDLAGGIVGEGAATELMAFLNIYRNLPDPDAVLLNPEKAVVPEDPATLYAMCGALAHRAGDQTVTNLVKYANRLPAEFSVLLMTDVIRREPKLVKTRAFIDWSSKHADVLI
jgi:hypothetical protein